MDTRTHASTLDENRCASRGSDRSFGILATADESALLGTKMVGTKKDDVSESVEPGKKRIFFGSFFKHKNGQTNSFLGDTGEWVDVRCVE
jgi:hypothetical protein